MTFDELLNKPLPSQLYEEDVEDTTNNDDDPIGDPPIGTADESSDDSECGGYGCESDDDDDFDALVSDIEDEEDIDVDTGVEVDDDDDIDAEEIEVDIEDEDEDDDEDDSEEPKPLTGSDDTAADNMMAITATPLLLKDELTAKECAEFFESIQGEIAIEEGLILEADATDLFEEGYKFAPANRKYMMTKQARYNQLYELAVQIEARNHNDPQYKKLQKIYKIKRQLKANLNKKYGNLAKRRARIYLKRLMTSQSPVLKKIGNDIKKGN